MIARFLASIDVLPDWVYLAIIAALLSIMAVSLGTAHVRVADAQRDVANAKQALAQEREWLAREAAEATDKARVAEGDLRDALDAQEGRDAESKRTIAKLEADLRQRSRAGGGSGLRDPYAAACPAGGAPGATGTVAATGAGDGAQTGGLVSEPLERLLLELASEADAINNAYGSCRADALSTRERLKELQTPATVPP